MQQLANETPVTDSRFEFNRVFTIHGRTVAVSANNEAVVKALQNQLHSFPVEDAVPAGDLAFKFEVGPSHLINRPVGPSRPVYNPNFDEVDYFDETDQLYINFRNRVRVLGTPRAGRAKFSISSQALVDNIWLATHPFFTVVLMELFKWQGLFSLHAAGLCIGNKVLLLPGISGAGKSTLTLALLRAGFGFMGDDTIFLRQGRTGLQALAFPDEMNVTETTIRFFPELIPLLDDSLGKLRIKRQLRPERIYPVEFVQTGEPAALLFPRVANCAASRITSLAPAEALLELAPNVLLTEAAAAQAHLDCLARLVKTTPCYRLETGRDFDSLPGRLRALLA